MASAAAKFGAAYDPGAVAASRPIRYLNYDDLVDCVGPATPLDQLRDLEILFLTFDEITGADAPSIFLHTPKLERLALLDNKMMNITGLEPISRTLTSLTICDQPITRIDQKNMHLPNLRSLFLHRNDITSLEGLSGCPRIKKLWIFQNKIKDLKGLHALPELASLWIQANQISSLRGIDIVPQLEDLALSGNPITDFAELNKLKKLTRLMSLSLSDVHFGRCPISEEPTYKEYVLTSLKQVRTLDDIVITKEKTAAAENTLQIQANQFKDALKSIESDFQNSIQDIDNVYSTRETHCVALEKEMAVALQELQVLVKDGRNAIASHVRRHEDLMVANMSSLETSLTTVLNKHTYDINEGSKKMAAEYDLVASLYLVLERVLVSEEALVLCMCDVYTYGMDTGEVDNVENKKSIAEKDKDKGNSKSKKEEKHQDDSTVDFAFQALPSSSPDFHLFAGQVQSTLHQVRPWSASSGSGSGSSAYASSITDKSGTNVCVFPLELVRLYRLCNDFNSANFNSQYADMNTNALGSSGMDRTSSKQQLQQFMLSSTPVPVQSIPGGSSTDRAGGVTGINSDMIQVFTILTVAELSIVLRSGWKALGKKKRANSGDNSSFTPTSALFCTHADVLAAIYSGSSSGANGSGNSFEFFYDESEYYRGASGGGKKGSSDNNCQSHSHREDEAGDGVKDESKAAAGNVKGGMNGGFDDGSLEDSYANDEFETSHVYDEDEEDEGSRVDNKPNRHLDDDNDNDSVGRALGDAVSKARSPPGSALDEVLEHAHSPKKKVGGGSSSSSAAGKKSKSGKVQKCGNGNSIASNGNKNFNSSDYIREAFAINSDSNNKNNNNGSDMDKLRQASDKNMYLIVSAHVSQRYINAAQQVKGSGGGGESTPPRGRDEGGMMTHFPPDRKSCCAFMKSLTSVEVKDMDGKEKSKEIRITQIDNQSVNRGVQAEATPRSGGANTASDMGVGAGVSSNKPVTFLSVPYSRCSSVLPNASLEYASICISPPVDGAGVRSIEGRLELLLLPTQHVDRSAGQLSAFHSEVSGLVQQHIGQLMEDLSQQHASALRSAENEIKSREKHLKNLRDDVEKERRQQDAILKDLRVLSVAQHGDADKDNLERGNGGGLTKSNSSKSGVRHKR